MPSRLLEPPRLDFGPGFHGGGIISIVPPKVGRLYTALVPLPDSDGMDKAGIRLPEVAVPLGTYTGWNLRRAGFSEGELCSLSGSFIAFAATRAERLRSGDPRPSLEERYHDHAGYVAAVRAGALKLEAEGWLLKEDGDRAIAAAEASAVLRSAASP